MRDQATDQRDRSEILRMIYGHRVSAVLNVVDSLGIADALAQGPRTSAELAAEVGAHPGALLRVLRGIAIVGLLDEVAPGRFALTRRGALLGGGVPGSVRRVATFTSDARSMRTWGELLHTAKTGEPTFDHVWGMAAFEYFAQSPEQNAMFNAAMARGTRQVAPGILAACDFSRFASIVDVGGGNGTLLALILAACPGARGIVQDTAAGAEDAPRALAAAGVADRIEVDHRDFFQSVSPGGDCYLLKHVVHGFDDAQSAAILGNVRAVIPANGRLLLIESVFPETVDASDESWMLVMGDLNMLVNTRGRERTEREYRDLLAAARFESLRVVPVEAPWPTSLIEAAPS